MLPKIYADFHNLDDANQIRLNTVGTRRDLERLGIELKEGLALTLYMDDADDEGKSDVIMVDGVVRFSSEAKCWVTVVDWGTIYHASDCSANNQPINPIAERALPANQRSMPSP